METQAISPATLRIILILIGVVVLVGIYFFGRPRKPGQGQGRRVLPRKSGDHRVDPVLGETGVDVDNESPAQGELDVALRRELDRLGSGGGAAVQAEQPVAGERPQEFPVDMIVTLYAVAPEGEMFQGSDIVVAAEKAGLRFGAMNVFHRLPDGRPDAGPIFSMANMVKPGYFDMDNIGELSTPGVTFFATLPGPLPALDAWDAMLPAAQRIAELLGGELLDEDRNALGRQRIAGLREDLRAWDRSHEGPEIKVLPRR